MSPGNVESDGLTLTILGCGTMGIAILSGILAALSETQSLVSGNPGPSASGTSTPAEVPAKLPSRFLTCSRRKESAKKVKDALASYKGDVTYLMNENLSGVQQADIVLLGCKPQMFRDILTAEGMRDALKGKLLISILAGVTGEQLEECLYGSDKSDRAQEPRCQIVRAMPNTAAVVRESMTVIATSVPPLPPKESALVTWIFDRVGRVIRLPSSSMDAATALCGSGPAFMALMLEAISDGAVAMGLPRAEAQTMAAQAMRGTTGMVLNGEHPAILRDKVSTPGGCTIGGLLVLEEGRVRGTLARAVREATFVASQLGQGVKNVNAIR